MTIYTLPAHTILCEIDLSLYKKGDLLNIAEMEDVGPVRVQECPGCKMKYLRCQDRIDQRCGDCRPWPY